MNYRFFIPIFCLAVWGCGYGKKTTFEKDIEENIYEVDPEDSIMNEAIKQARSTFPEFEKAFSSKDTNMYDFGIKMVFNHEHLWFAKIMLKNEQYYGILANVTDYEENQLMNLGDTFKIEMARVTDWQYSYADTIYGDYTMRVFRDMMSKADRDEFDEQTGFIYQ